MPSLAVALGGIGMRLQDLTQLYVGIARGGEPVPLTWRRDGASLKTRLASEREAAKKRLLSPVAAWYVGDILKMPAPLNARAASSLTRPARPMAIGMPGRGVSMKAHDRGVGRAA